MLVCPYGLGRIHTQYVTELARDSTGEQQNQSNLVLMKQNTD